MSTLSGKETRKEYKKHTDKAHRSGSKDLQRSPQNIHSHVTTNGLKPTGCFIITFSALAPYLPISTYPFRKHPFKKKQEDYLVLTSLAFTLRKELFDLLEIDDQYSIFPSHHKPYLGRPVSCCRMIFPG